MLSTPIHAPYSHAGSQRVRLTSHEVIARLGLLDAPALDLGFWKGTKGRHDIWRTLTTLLRYRKAESPSVAPEALLEGACLDDRVVRQQEGFDFYGMLANGYALLPLLRVTPHQGRKDVGHVMVRIMHILYMYRHMFEVLSETFGPNCHTKGLAPSSSCTFG
jgi:hypothetical protein